MGSQEETVAVLLAAAPKLLSKFTNNQIFGADADGMNMGW